MEQQSPLVTVVVPVYNSQFTLDRCLKSICAQTYRNLEILAVDDGSADASRQIIARWAAADSRVRLIAKANGGVSQCRNTGIRQAQGRFLQFVDSDDRIPPSSTQTLVSQALSRDCQLVVADYYMVTGGKYMKNGSIQEPGLYTRRQFAQLMMRSPSDFYYGVMWNKLYCADLVRRYDLACPQEMNWGEDFFFNLEYLRYVDHVAVVKRAVYYYIRRKNSLSLSKNVILSALPARMALFSRYKELYEGLDLYENNKLGISLYPLTFAHAAGYPIPREVAEADAAGERPPRQRGRGRLFP